MEKDLADAFDCKCEGELTEYVGSKIDIASNIDGLGTVKFTQPVLVQKLEDEFDLLTQRQDSKDTCNSWSSVGQR